MEITLQQSLRFLLERYLENPALTVDIAQCADQPDLLNIPALHELGAHLVRKGFVKDHRFKAAGFECSITLLGINQVSNLMDEMRLKVLQASIEDKKRSLVEILGFRPQDFRKVLDCANHLKKAGLVECIFHHHDVLASPTFFGREWYASNKVSTEA